MLMVGPPGCGKTMLARRMVGILPPLEDEEAVKVATAWAAADRIWTGGRRRPFRAPHHSASVASVLGGGSGRVVAGEVSLASSGVLFLDELGEFPPHLLDSLRQPLEDGEVRLARRGRSLAFPAKVQLVAAANPCPCGYLGDRTVACRCSEASLARYQRRMSGPLLDRIDMRIAVARPTSLLGPPGEPSAVVRARVLAARHLAAERGELNAEMGRSSLDALAFEPGALSLVNRAVVEGRLTGRGFDRVRRIARTIADLAESRVVGEGHVAEAMTLRG